MVGAIETEPSDGASSAGGDAHGSGRITRSILSNWGGQLVLIISGFLVPRMIDHHIGQEQLGIWDFAWAIVSYMGLIQMGIVSSINRYIAFHQAREDRQAIVRYISSAAAILRLMACVVLLVSFILGWGAGYFFKERLGHQVVEARWLIFILGAELAVQIWANVYGSILTGFHRWGLHNGIITATYGLTLGGMIIALLAGYGLVGMAVASLTAEIAARCVRAYIIYRDYPWLEIRLKHFRRSAAWEMFCFGGKASVSTVSQLLVSSSVNVLVALYFGAPVLALYARPRALLRSVNVVLNRYANVFVPTLSSFQGAGRRDQIRSLVLKATRYGLFISLPILFLLMIFGGEVLRLWMGHRYVNSPLVMVLVAGLFHQCAYAPLSVALMGLNLHGKPAVVDLFGSMFALSFAFLALRVFHGGVIWMAVGLGIPTTLINAFWLPRYACQQLGITYRSFWTEIWQLPLLCALPYVACLCGGKLVFPNSPWLGFVCGGGAGAIVLTLCYWKLAMPKAWKRAVVLKLGRFRGQNIAVL